MTKFEIHTIDSAPVNSTAALRALQQGLGFVPNLAATMAGSPALVCGFVDLRNTLAGGELTGAEREIVALATSIENDCDYCMAAHSTFALMQDADEGAVTAVRAGHAPDDARLGALYCFARALVARRGHISQTETQALIERRLLPCLRARSRCPGRVHDPRQPRPQHRRRPTRCRLQAAGMGQGCCLTPPDPGPRSRGPDRPPAAHPPHPRATARTPRPRPGQTPRSPAGDAAPASMAGPPRPMRRSVTPACEPVAEPAERYVTAEAKGAELVAVGTVPT